MYGSLCCLGTQSLWCHRNQFRLCIHSTLDTPFRRHQHHPCRVVATPQLRLIMVRVKYRYLVVNILYPEPVAKSKAPLPDLVQIHSPTPDAFHAGALVRLIREGVEDLYGDYGSAMVSTGLKGASWSMTTSLTELVTHIQHSQLLVPIHLDRHHPLSTRPL